MLKGILPQLTSISTYVQSILPLEHQDLTWEIYLLNTQKNTFEILKLVQIILSQLEQSLPKGVKSQYERSCSLLKRYFKCRPKLEIDHEEHDKQLHGHQYDEVQQYLDNKPEITINNEQRSELFKFLSNNDQKQKDNAMLLQSIPRYNFDYSYHRNSTHQNQSVLDKTKPNIKKCDSQTIQNCSSEVNIFKFSEEVQVQTDPTNVLGHQQAHQTCEMSTSMTDFEHIQTNDGRKKHKNTGQFKKQNENDPKKKKQKNSIREEGNIKMISQSRSNPLIIQNDLTSELKRKARPSAMVSEAKTIKEISNLQTFKQQNRQKNKKKSKRQSRNSVLSNKKDVKSIFSKNSQKRMSKDLKELKDNKIFNQSKFSKQKKNGDNPYPTTILQTKQQLTTSYVNGQTNSQNVTFIKENQQAIVVQEGFNCNNSRVIINIPANPKATEESITKQENTKDACNISQKTQNIQREKVSSAKDDFKKYQLIVQKAYANTIGHPFYRKASKNQKSDQQIDHRSLPKIQQKNVNVKVKYESIEGRKKKKTFENSPYAKPSVQVIANQKIFKNSTNQINHRSFHLNPLQKLGFSPTTFNRTQKTQKSQKDLEGSYKNCSSFPKFEMNPANYVGQVQRQQMLQDEHSKILKQIQQSISNKGKDFQWTKLMKNIKNFEHLHINLCGENCVHLNKFYEFLKKKNLSIYANRKELLLHKKNIEINFH